MARWCTQAFSCSSGSSSLLLERSTPMAETARSTLIAHCGARVVTRAELDRIEPPSATASWRPIKHAAVLDTVGEAMLRAGFRIVAVKTAVTRGDHRLFATIDTATDLNAGAVTLAVAVVNSTDKSL